MAVLPGITQQSQSVENVLGPSPPLSAPTVSGHKKSLSFHERRLRPGLTRLETSLPDINRVGRFSETYKASEVPDLKPQRVLKLPKINVPRQSLPALIPHPPPTRRYGNHNNNENNTFEVKYDSPGIVVNRM